MECRPASEALLMKHHGLGWFLSVAFGRLQIFRGFHADNRTTVTCCWREIGRLVESGGLIRGAKSWKLKNKSLDL